MIDEKMQWYGIVAIENNQDYLSSLLKKCGIVDYNFAFCNGNLSLYFTYNLSNYRVDIDTYEQCLILMKKNLCGNKGKDKFHFVKSFKTLDWYDVLKFVTKIENNT